MAKKDFDKYVLKMYAQLKELEDTLKQISQEANDNMTDLDYVDRLEQQIAPIKENYQRLMYIKFLLDQPTKKEKQENYNRRIQKLKKTLLEQNSTDNVLEENKKIIESVKNKNF